MTSVLSSVASMESAAWKKAAIARPALALPRLNVNAASFAVQAEPSLNVMPSCIVRVIVLVPSTL